ncbi:hypothetical protein ACFX2I_009854 [Malus domestica]
MTPMGQAAAAEVYVPMTLQAWRVVNWVGFFYQIILQILRGAPCLPHLLSCISSSSSPAFRPLPVAEVPLNDLSSSAHVENGVLDGRPVEKLTVVLDLDETLVCAYETCSVPAIVRARATEAGMKWFEMECLSSEKESDGKPKINYVTVFERPGLGEFLKRVSEFADLALFRFLLQPLNGIPCVPFSAGQPYDDLLLEVLLPLLKQLSLQKDVRPTLQERFHMAEWFQMHGFHVCG